jgi:hypothetical protein
MSAPELARLLKSALWLDRSSTEIVQEQETAREDDQWNPEMDVGGDHAKQIYWSIAFDWRSHSRRRTIC